MKTILIAAILAAVCAPRSRTLCFDIVNGDVTEKKSFWLWIERKRCWKFDEIVCVTTGGVASDRAGRRYQLEMLTAVEERIAISTTVYSYSRSDKEFCRQVANAVRDVLDEGRGPDATPIELMGEIF